MKKQLFLFSLLLLLVPVSSWGQVNEQDTLGIEEGFVDGTVETMPKVQFKKDRFIYLWDVTTSMQGEEWVLKNPSDSKSGYVKSYNKVADIYDLVVDELIRDINGITDETAEIVVIPFQSSASGSYRGDQNPWIYKTASGPNKQELIDKIRSSKKNWLTYRHVNTDIVPALSFVINSVISEDRKDIVKILTDGKMNDIPGLRQLMSQWCDIASKKKDMHAFYISLNEEADQCIKSIISEAQKQDCPFKIISPGPDGSIAIEMYEVVPYPNIAVNANDQFASSAPFVTAQMQVKGPGKLPTSFKVHFESDENPFISVNVTSAVKDNSFNVPFSFKMDFDEMRRHFNNGMKYPVKVHLTAVDGDNVYLLEDIITLYLTVKKEKKMTISWE